MSQEIQRYGTTAANFLEIGIGSAPSSMGEAYVSVARDVSSLYWNPAGLAHIKGTQLQFMSQPWIVGINNIFAGAALHVPGVGSFGMGVTQLSYGDMAVTTLEHQTGTGENFTANEIAVSAGFGRKLANWFAFGATTKLVRSSIWHTSASAMAVDLGVAIETGFFKSEKKAEEGLVIAMSISNYGTKMKYDGMDLLNPIDISEFENGNYGDVPGQFRTQGWDLPLIFRVGTSMYVFKSRNQSLQVAVDALHPNNNVETLNFGADYSFYIPGRIKLSLRGGYKGYRNDVDYNDTSIYGLTAGIGIRLFFFGNKHLTVDYAYKSMGLLGNINAYTVAFDI